MTTLREIENLGFSLQDNICVFCSKTYEANATITENERKEN